MSQKRLIEYSGVSKRVFAFLIDILCTLLIAINLNNFVFSNLTKESLGTTVLEQKVTYIKPFFGQVGNDISIKMMKTFKGNPV